MAMTVSEALANAESLLGEQIIVEGHPLGTEKWRLMRSKQKSVVQHVYRYCLVAWETNGVDDTAIYIEESEIRHIMQASFSRLHERPSRMTIQGTLAQASERAKYALTNVQYAIATTDNRSYAGYFKAGGVDFDFIGFDCLPLTEFEDLLKDVDSYIGKLVRLDGILTGNHAGWGDYPSEELSYLISEDHLAELHNLRLILVTKGESAWEEASKKQESVLQFEKRHGVYLKYKGIFSLMEARISPRNYAYEVQMIGTLDKSEIEPFVAAFGKHNLFIANRKSPDCIYLWNPSQFPEVGDRAPL